LPFLTASAILISSCNIFGPDKPIFENDEFRIQVDSVNAVQTLNDSLIVRFWGVIGRDSCQKFWHYQSHLEPHKLEITLWGHKEVTTGNICNAGNINLNGQQYRVYPVEAGDFEIIVKQPNGSPLVRTKRIN